MFTTAVVFFIILSILILVHEFGHYITARLMGVRVEEFGLGLPPRAIGKKIKHTVYSLNWLPIGGFVKLAGEDEEDQQHKSSGIPTHEYFWAKSKKQRALILTAGVIMNFLLATLIMTYFLIIGTKLPSDKVSIETISPNSPAAQAGMKPGDRILFISRLDNATGKIQKIDIKSTNDLISTVSTYKGTPLSVMLLRGSNPTTVSVTPRAEYPAGEGPMGVAITDLVDAKYPFYLAPFMAIKINLERAVMMIMGIGTTIATLIFGKASQLDVAGPIGIAQITGQAVKYGFNSVLEFTSILSLNLAVLNILPFPALDGGRLFFVFAEKIMGRRVKSAFERKTHQIGMLILLALVLLVSINDIARILRGGN